MGRGGEEEDVPVHRLENLETDGPDIPTCRISPSAWRARSSEMASRMRSSSPGVRTASVLLVLPPPPPPSLNAAEARP